MASTRGPRPGTDGAIGRTTDGGDTWVLQKTGTTINLTAVSFVDTRNGWVVGTAGTLLRTNDAGDTWEKLDSIKGVLFTEGVQFVNATTGWVAADFGSMFHTTDGGLTWTKQDTGSLEDLNDLLFVDDRTGWAVGFGGTILHTADAGTTWTAQDSGGDTQLNSVWFLDPNVGAVVGQSGMILYTTDGGTTWTATNPGNFQASYGWYLSTVVIHPTDSDIVFVGGLNLLRSTTGGAFWSNVTPPHVDMHALAWDAAGRFGRRTGIA